MEKYTPAKPITQSLKEKIEMVVEVKDVVKTPDGGTTTSDLKLSHLKGNKYPYLSLTGHRRDPGETKPSMFGTIHGEILKAHPDGKYHLAAKYHLHTYAPGTEEHGAPIHALENAYYHAGIGEYSKQNADNLAGHLVTPKEHAQAIIDHAAHLPDEESKKRVVKASVEGMKHHWANHMDAIVAKHNLKVEHS